MFQTRKESFKPVSLSARAAFMLRGALAVSSDGSVVVGYAVIPEPSTLALLGGGAITLLG